MDNVMVGVRSCGDHVPYSFGGGESIVRDGWILSPVGVVGKLPHYSGVCGSCSAVPMPFHNVVGGLLCLLLLRVSLLLFGWLFVKLLVLALSHGFSCW